MIAIMIFHLLKAMSDFHSFVDSKVISKGFVKSAQATFAAAAVDGARSLLIYSESLPYVGHVAKLINGVIAICDQHKCNKEAFKQLKTRLYRLAQLFFGEGGLASIAKAGSKNEILRTFTKRMEVVLNDAIVNLGSFAKVGFLSSILSGNKPQLQFNQLDADLTACMNELAVALQAAQLNEQAETYKVVCNIESKINSNGKGLQGVYADPVLLQSLADEIGADVDDVKIEVKDQLDRIEAMLNQTGADVKITYIAVEELRTEFRKFAGAFNAADKSSVTLTSTPVINHLKVLGRGSFATVYEAKYNNEYVAVKVFAATAAFTTAKLNELSKEVLMHNKVCNLPGVVRLFGANLTTEPRCVVLELADGSLHDVLHKRKPAIDLSLTSKLSLAVQISSAMGCISDLGVVHRDIKSSNVLIFLQSQGRVSAKLADFGLAKVNTEDTYSTSHTPKGTPPYMAPELFKGEYSSASDVYAFAIMLNELLQEEVPFPGASLHEIMMKVGTHRGRPKAFVAPASDAVGCRLTSLISTCWNQDAQLRLTFQAVAVELNHALAASAEIARNGTFSASADGPPTPRTPHTPHSPEAAIEAITEWLTTSCDLLPYDSTSLAHTLVTTKCITSVAALNEVLHQNPALLTQELKIAAAYDLQIKKVLHQMDRTALVDLTVEQVGILLNSVNLQSIQPIILKRNISGTILAASFDSVEELIEIGMEKFTAKALFKLVTDWKAHGLPSALLKTTPVASHGSDGFEAIHPKQVPAWDFKGPNSAPSHFDESPWATSFPLPAAPPMQGPPVSALNHNGPGAAAPVSGTVATKKTPDHVIASAQDIPKAKTADSTIKGGGTVNSPVAAGSQIQGEQKKAASTPSAAARDAPDAHALERLYTCARYHGDTVARKQLQDIAEKGIHLAEAFLSILYESGCNGLPTDDNKAEHFAKLAVPWLITEAGSHNNPQAQYCLGQYYDVGTGVSKSELEAVRYYRMAADQGHAASQYNLGAIYSDGTGVTRDDVEAVRYFKLAADQGYAVAQCNMGLCYDLAMGVTKNEVEAARYLKLAADQGYSQAQSCLGECYDNGTGVSMDKSAAFRYYKLAADQGDADVQYRVGEFYSKGTGVATNTAAALRYYKLAADQGHAEAQCAVGICYHLGMGVTKKEAEAVRYYKLAADQHHAGAQYRLGVCYCLGTGVTKDDVQAVRYYKLAADQGYAAAQFNLGACSEYGTGLPKDQREAVRYYKLAADQGHASAQYNLGNGVPKNDAEAVRYFKLAADQGVDAAQHCLAVSYASGTGVAEDPAKAARYFKLAADQGFANAQFRLGVCYHIGSGIAVNHAEAARYFKMAADQGHADAQYLLGKCFKEGNGVEKDKAQAKKYFKLAADQGKEEAARELSKFWF